MDTEGQNCLRVGAHPILEGFFLTAFEWGKSHLEACGWLYVSICVNTSLGGSFRLRVYRCDTPSEGISHHWKTTNQPPSAEGNPIIGMSQMDGRRDCP